jgi:hypothetical protein
MTLLDLDYEQKNCHCQLTIIVEAQKGQSQMYIFGFYFDS